MSRRGRGEGAVPGSSFPITRMYILGRQDGYTIWLWCTRIRQHHGISYYTGVGHVPFEYLVHGWFGRALARAEEDGYIPGGEERLTVNQLAVYTSNREIQIITRCMSS